MHELVKIHGGTVGVNSEVGKGSEFLVRIPKGKTHLNELDVQGQQETKKNIDTGLYLSGMSEVEDATPLPDKKDQFILVVDDNEDMRLYLKGLLSATHKIQLAVDGQDALESAI